MRELGGILKDVCWDTPVAIWLEEGIGGKIGAILLWLLSVFIVVVVGGLGFWLLDTTSLSTEEIRCATVLHKEIKHIPADTTYGQLGPVPVQTHYPAYDTYLLIIGLDDGTSLSVKVDETFYAATEREDALSVGIGFTRLSRQRTVTAYATSAR